MCKGIFWVVDEIDGKPLLITRKVLCDASGLPLERGDFDSKSGESFNHRKSWLAAVKGASREVRNKVWNYFPRGRVEIRNGSAVVYHNPTLSEVTGFCETVLDEFELTSVDMQIHFLADFSRHYEFGQ